MHKVRHYAGIALLVLGAFYLLLDGVRQPYFNWDIVGYVASAYAADGLQGAHLSQATYQDLRNATSPSTYYQLTQVDAPRGYRDRVFQDPQALQQQLPFYSVRVAYVGLMRLLNRQGVDLARASYLISAVFAAASLLVAWPLARSLGVDLLWVPFVGLAAGLDMLARLSTPDALACFAMLLTAWMFLRGHRLRYLLAMILPAVRTDLVMLSVLMLVYDYWFDWKTAALSALACAVAVYGTINAVSHNYGWLTLFNFQMMGITPYPASMRIDPWIADYVRVYQRAALDWVSSVQTLPSLLGLQLLFMGLRRLRSNPRQLATVSIFTVYALLHYLLFPLGELRFFTPSIMVVMLGALALLGPVRVEQDPSADSGHATVASI